MPGASSIACIPAAKTVDVNGTRTVQALHLDANTDVFVDSGDALPRIPPLRFGAGLSWRQGP